MLTDQLHPGVPDATPEDRAFDLSTFFAKWSQHGGATDDSWLPIRLTRRAATAERRLAEAEQAAGLAKALERFENWAATKKAPYYLDVYVNLGWTLRCLDTYIFGPIPTADLARELGAWLDQQDGKP